MTRALALTALVGTTLTACTALEPPREPPPLTAPVRYTVAEPAQPPGGTEAAPHLLPGAAPVPQWWQAYGSPELDQLVGEGLAANPSLEAAQSSLRAAREALKAQIGQSVLPQIDLTMGAQRGRQLTLPGLATQSAQGNELTAQVSASYTFDFFGAAFLANRALAAQLRQQTWQLEATRRALAARIVTATITVTALHEQLTTTQQLVDLGEDRARQLAGRYRNGSATHDEALSAEQDAADAAAVLPALRAQLAAARHAQAVLLGRTPDQAPEPLPLDSLKPPAGVPVTLPSLLLHQRPDILAAESALASAADAAGAARAAMFPSLTLSAAYGRGAFDWSTFTSPAGAIWGVGSALTQPLFHGGALQARARSYRAQYDTAVAQYRQTVLAAFSSVADSLASLEEDGNTLVQTQRAENAARELRGSSDAKYRLGATSFYITLTAGQQYLNAHLQHIRARAAQLTDAAALLDAMGEPPDGNTHVAAR